MTAILKDSLEYLGGQMANLEIQDKTASGDTDDKHEGEPGQTEMIAAGSTDARKIANNVFGKSKLRIPCEVMATGDVYDVTQGHTRINQLYAMTRADFYKQAASLLATRKNRLERKQRLVSSILRLAEAPKKAMGEIDA